jgi:beta-N-acetylhexosaminidase
LRGQLICVGVAGTRLSPGERRALKRFTPGAVILFKRNYKDRAQLTALCAEIHRACEPAPLIAVDQEGGRVVRFGAPFMHLDAARTLARWHTPNEVEELAASMALELRAAGVAIDFAPVLDVLTNPANQVIGDRAFGTTAKTVTRHGLAFMRGLLRGGVAPCGKHFPGHGNVREDSHFELPVSQVRRRSLFDVHLKPFVAAIAAGIPMIMLAHVMIPWIDPARPASLSPAVVNGILRQQLGFAGVVATDDLQMEALHGIGGLEERTAAALEAGADLILVCRPIAETERVFVILKRLSQSPALRASMNASARRITALRHLMRQKAI